MQIPNGCGSFLGLAQLILYAIYRNNKGAAAPAGKGEAAAEVEDVATEFLAGARKKTKTAARRGKAGAAGGSGAAGGTVRAVAMEMKCQVPGCEADIRELKGYHRRHRVCLRCAHASAVLLDGVQKRYCQQCGK